MQSFKQFLAEVTIANTNQFAKEIEKAIKGVFPKAFIKAKFSGGIIESIHVRFASTSNKAKWPNGYIENDRLHQTFMIFDGFENLKKSGPVNVFDKGDPGVSSRLIGKHNIDISVGGRLSVPGSGVSGKTVKFGWRKKSGDAATIVKHLESYFQKVKKVVADNPDLMR